MRHIVSMASHTIPQTIDLTENNCLVFLFFFFLVVFGYLLDFVVVLVIVFVGVLFAHSRSSSFLNPSVDRL